MWFGVCIALAMDLVPPEVSSAAVSLYLFIVNIIGGNLNLLLPSLQAAIGLRYSMVILFPGAYILSGVFFILAGCFWKFRYLGPSRESLANEQKGLIQDCTNEDPVHVLTESKDINKTVTKTTRSFHLVTSLSYTASI